MLADNARYCAARLAHGGGSDRFAGPTAPWIGPTGSPGAPQSDWEMTVGY
jgi:hypothetical protein